MSPDTALLTTSSSVQVSPEPMRGREEESCPSNFQLPESIISRKTSNNSLSRHPASVSSSIAPTDVAPVTSNNSKTNLIRRISSRASRRITNTRRRQSSAAPTPRDGSVGPCFLRRRSDSNSTAPPEFSLPGATDTESDGDERDELNGYRAIFALDGPLQESATNSTHGSISGSSSTMAGPVVPLPLQRGTWLRKISKKSRSKRICVVYDTHTNKLLWDRSRPHKAIHIDDLREVRSGPNVRQNGLEIKMPEADNCNCLTIVYSLPDKSSRTKYMDLVADDSATRDMLTNFLDAMLRHRQDVMTSLMAFDDKAIAQYWQSEMSRQFRDQPRNEHQEELDIVAVKRVCQNLHIYSSQITLETHFRLSDARRRERLNFNEFLTFVRRMNHRRDVQRIMRKVAADPRRGLSLQEFLTFLRDVQGEDIESSRPFWENTFTKFARKYITNGTEVLDNETPKQLFMSEAALVGYLTSASNAPLVPEPQEYNLDRPVNEYFISSSHNTYLMGRQVMGQSNVECYISALVQGCRCVEVDCWDGPDGQPQVVHGHTLTTAIDFRETMITINKYAFFKTRFPLWISLEVHCNPTQQAVMVAIIMEVFGNRLVTDFLDPESTKLPSPSQLIDRICIKVKKSHAAREPSSEPVGRRRGNSLTSPMMTPSVPDSPFFSGPSSLPQSPLLSPSSAPGRRLVGKSRVNTINEEEAPELLSSSASDNESDRGSTSGKKPPNKTIPILGKLGVYCAGVKFTGFEDPEAKKFNHIFSFMESSFAKNSRTKEDKMALDIHNMRYLMRVYPERTRFSSSNFDPLIYWRRGVQMAALNWQTHDHAMQLNQAMFAGGPDSSGYVLKPRELRDIQVLPYNSDLAQGKKERSVVSFSIDVISAQQLMRPAGLPASKSMDPYVEVEVFHANDKRDKKEGEYTLPHRPDTPLKFQTEVIRENGFNPMFNEGNFRFRVTTKHPELIFVRWSVKLSSDGESYNNSSRPPAASYTAKLSNLKQGYRTLPLLNHTGDQYLFSTLFCRIKLDSIEKRLVDGPRPVQDGGKLNRLGGKVFGRINTSPRGTVEKSSAEKSSFES
jgi:phosphatidylinositol phospholipase C delta